MKKKPQAGALPAKAFPLREIGFGALILCAALVSYWPAIQGGLLWDDDAHVTRQGMQTLHGLWRIWFDLGATQQYYPLLHTAFWFEHRLWGDAVLGYHLMNVLLHVAAACLAVAIMRRLALPGAWLAGLLFALHPVCVEAVAWISEQKSTLSAVFYLASALAYLRFDRTRRPWHYGAALGLFACALLSKTVTATLPAALLLVFWFQRGRIEWKRDAKPLLPWFVLAAAGGTFTAWVERTYIGAQGARFAVTPVDRVLVAGRAIWFYLGKLVWPRDLMFTYPRWAVDAGEWWQYLFPLGALAAAGGLWIVARKHRGPLAGFLYFAGTLFPALGFFNVYPFVYSYVADHFQYLATLGVIVPAASGLALAARRLPAASRWFAPACGVGLAAFLGGLTWAQSGMYSDAETLYRETLAHNPGAWMAHNNLGSLLEEVPGRLPEVIAEYQAALRIRPDYAEAHFNLGNALSRIPGRLPEAIAEYQAALRSWPDYPEAHDNLGNALSGIPGQLPDAIAEYQAALRTRPDYPEAHDNLGNALSKMPGRLPDAIAEYQAALRIRPDYPEAHFNLGNAYSRIPGRLPDAIAEYRSAVRARPDYADAHTNLGNALAEFPNRLAEAIVEYQAALRIQPDYPEAHNGLGNALSAFPNRSAEAMTEYQAAVRFRPDYAEAHYNLASLLAGMPGRLPEAIVEFQAALRANPDLAEAHCALGFALARTPSRSAEAIAHLEAALRLRPDLQIAREALARLGRPR